jgi:hypothetical protein
VSQLIVPQKLKGRTPAQEGDRSTRRSAWVFLAAAGALLGLAGFVRVGFFLVPVPDSSDAEWQFWAATSSLDLLWQPAAGAAIAMAAFIGLHSVAATRLLVLAFLVLAAVAAAAGLIALRSGPVVLEAGSDPDARILMIRAAILTAIYAPGFVWLALTGWRCAYGRA